MALPIDIALLQRFEEGLNALEPEKSKIPARILGYGEISTVFQLEYPGQEGFAYKRMPIFASEEQVVRYAKLYYEYHDILNNQIGIRVPPYDLARLTTSQGRIVVYDVQAKLPEDSIGNKIIQVLSKEEIELFIQLILSQMKKVWDFNRKNENIQVGIDSQISNWAVMNLSSSPKITDTTELVYLDTSTPLIRKNGVDLLETELFLQSIPGILRWIPRLLFLKHVLDCYYNFRRTILDLIGNIYKEGRADMVPSLTNVVNRFFAQEGLDFHIKPFTWQEIRAYYTKDAFMWSFLLHLRRLDRFIQGHVLRRNYEFLLPGKIRR
jgi:hypothetical protein